LLGKYGNWEYGVYTFERNVLLRNMGRDAAVMVFKKGGNSHNGTTSEEQERPMQLAYYFWVLGDTLCHQVTEAQHFNI
jgi:hypothetical protein